MEDKKKLIVSVKQLNNYIKLLIEGDEKLNSLYLKGEISNFTNHYKSGHFYLTIKDEESAIRAVMFKGSASKLKFMPKDGMKIIALGRVSVFPRDGQYQFYIDSLVPDGLGDLNLAFEQLKEKLAAEGLFDEKRKKPIPNIPASVGVITSPTGAAVRDIINVLKRRHPIAKVYLIPVLVQGEGAPPTIIEAIKYFNEKRPVDVIISGRGGGSLEELWAFNDEGVARAISASKIPIISAVGHETDFTISDFVADLRAPTPSAAAELAVPDKSELSAKFSNVSERLCLLLKKDLKSMNDRLLRFSSSPVLLNPMRSVDEKKLYFDFVMRNLLNSAENIKNRKKEAFSCLCAKLDALSPLSVLVRGFCMASDEGGKVLKSVKDIEKNKNINLSMADGNALCKVLNITGGK